MWKLGLLFIGLLLFTSFAIAGCAQPAPTGQEPPPEEVVPKPEEMAPRPELPPDASEAAFAITSSAFAAGAGIPAKYTCDGQNASPPLDWGQCPSGIASLALIVDDPDAPFGVFIHWIIFNLPSGTRSLPEAVPKDGNLADGVLQGKNGFGKIGYAGPCPPSGSPHRYRFTLYALDKPLGLAAGVSKEQVLAAMEGHILAQSQLIGIYQR
jgi:Raf kinase inhibitor-like YbhB/YbcL family protein